ncbi:MAG: ParA family protein [Hyphomicrobiales bacterium]|nr:ParA family protein [Hyphomicrobiales bacterium]
MISILVVNAKGGCGKTTIATNLATAFANAGLRTALADCDRQRSCLGWLKRRPKDMPEIVALDWHKAQGKVPDGIERLVMDTGAGLRSSRVQEALKPADMIVIPVLPSVFDERATRTFLKKVDTLKPVRKGKKPVGIVGNRLRSRTRAEAELDEFLAKLGHEVAARLRDRAIYQDVARRGLGIFDLSPGRRAGAVEEWLPLIRLIESQDGSVGREI